jgi:hypothetical protein
MYLVGTVVELLVYSYVGSLLLLASDQSTQQGGKEHFLHSINSFFINTYDNNLLRNIC